MDIQAEKINLIQWLAGIEDAKIINQLKMLQITFQEKEPVALTKEVKAAIDQGLRSIEAGRIKTHKEVTNSTRDKYPNLFS